MDTMDTMDTFPFSEVLQSLPPQGSESRPSPALGEEHLTYLGIYSTPASPMIFYGHILKILAHSAKRQTKTQGLRYFEHLRHPLLSDHS